MQAVLFAQEDATTKRARLEYIEDRNGNRISCTYDANGKLDFVTDAAGRILDFSYDAAGFLSTITDWMTAAEGGPRVWSYTVNADHDLVSYMDPVQRQKPVSERRAWMYEYYTNQSNAPMMQATQISFDWDFAQRLAWAPRVS